MPEPLSVVLISMRSACSDRLGLTVTGQHVAGDHTVLACRVVEPDDVTERGSWCDRCGAQGVPCDTVVRKLAHVPVGWRPTVLHVTVRRYRCIGLRVRVAAGHQLGGGGAVEVHDACGVVGVEVGGDRSGLDRSCRCEPGRGLAHRQRRRPRRRAGRC